MKNIEEAAKARKIFTKRVKRLKISALKAFTSNIGAFIVSFVITAAFLAAAVGMWTFVTLVGFFVPFDLSFVAALIPFLTVFPLLDGNIKMCRKAASGEQVKATVVFSGYFTLKDTYLRLYAFVLYFAPYFVFLCALAVLARNASFVPGVILEIVLIILMFFTFCKALYFLRIFDSALSPEGAVKRAAQRYNKRKQDFRKYVLSHGTVLLVIVLVRFLPDIVACVIALAAAGYYLLSASSFDGELKLKINKNKLTYRRSKADL